MKKLYLLLSLALATVSGAASQEASYEHPTALRYIGTIENPNPSPVCLFTTRNPINDGAFLWAPAKSAVKYTDTSTGTPKSWEWESDGGIIENASHQDALILYNEAATYDFPKLTVNYADGPQVYKPELKLKVGGKAELCLADCRTWLETYALGVNVYSDANGCLGGTNTLDIVGVGNLYMISLEEGFLDGVNVYLHHKPTRYAEGAKLGIRIWMANITQDGVTLAAVPLEGSEISFDDIETEEDGVWVPIDNGAVARMNCSVPIDLFGKPFIFIDVYGWGTDPSSEDLQMLMDVMPNVQMKPENAQNLLAHNSFVRLNNENDYLRPVSYFGGNYGSFMICPVVRGGETPFGAVASIATDNATSLTCSMSGDLVTVSGPDGGFTVHDIAGRLRHEGEILDGAASFPTSSLGNGVYIIRARSGETAKFIVR